jgi:hypothetical protein
MTREARIGRFGRRDGLEDSNMVSRFGPKARTRPFPWRLVFWSIPVGLLFLPALAMQFSEEVNWDAFDFVFATIIFGSIGLVIELAVRSSSSIAFRSAVVLAVGASFLIIWVNGAVGIIGDEDNPANLMFGAVLATALFGSMAALFRPAGMALAMFAAAAVQLVVGAIALGAGMASGPAAPYDVIVATLVLTAMWLLSGILFRLSSREAKSKERAG